MLMQIGNPPKQPDKVLASAKIRDYFLTSPKSPPPYFLPLLSNSSRYRNCSKMMMAVMTKEAGKSVRSCYIFGATKFSNFVI